MGLFENLGRTVETFKQEVADASKDQAAYQCGDCGTLVYGGRDDCPDCGGEDLVARKSESDQADGTSPSESTDGDAQSETTDGESQSSKPDDASGES